VTSSQRSCLPSTPWLALAASSLSTRPCDRQARASVRGRGWMQRGAQEGTVAAREDGLPAAAQRIAKKAAAAWIGRSRARARTSVRPLACAALRPPHPSRHLRPPLSHVAMPAAGVVAASLRRATTSLPPSQGSHTEDCCICMWAMALVSVVCQ
jgi:hypothetical protein